MSHILDNMIWNSITTGNRDIAIVEGDIGYYRQDIAPFAGMKMLTHSNLEKLYECVPVNSKIAISSLKKQEHDVRKWKLLQPMDVSQMVYQYPVDSFITNHSQLIRPLTDDHITEMIALTASTKPGPFYSRTIEFGNYFGIFINGRLAAMTGQRMHPTPFMEVSAVCTHPDFRGKGYAKALMLHIMQIILDNSFIPFLHVLTSNIPAIRLYESIGYRKRKEIYVDMIERL